jgi:hypothetical protein
MKTKAPITLEEVERYFELALFVVTEAHEGQTRADQKTPYIVHPVEVARRVRNRIQSMAYPLVAIEARKQGLAEALELLLIAGIAALGHDAKEDNKEYPLAQRFIEVGIPEVYVTPAIVVINQMTNASGGDYLDYILWLKEYACWITLLIKEEDMNVNYDDTVGIPSKGRQKSMRTKYLLAHYILFGRKPYAALR